MGRVKEHSSALFHLYGVTVLLSVNTRGAPRAFSNLKLGKLNYIKLWLLRTSLLVRSKYRVGLLMRYSEMDIREGYDIHVCKLQR